MSNNVQNSSLAPQFVAAESLRTLTPQMVKLKQIATTDFGDYVSDVGQTVFTRYANSFTAQVLDPAVGFTDQDAVSNTVAITLDRQLQSQVSFNDFNVSTISLQMLRDTFLAPLTNSVVKGVFDQVLGLAISANFATAAYSGSKASFSRISIANVSTSMTNANLPFEGRALLMSPNAYGQLLQDPSVAQYLSYGDREPIVEGRTNRLHGIDLHEYNGFPLGGLPTTGLPAQQIATNVGLNTAFAEGLNGVASCRQGICIATRVPSSPAGFGGTALGGGEQIIVTDPTSSFSYALRTYYTWGSAKTSMVATWITGAAVGNPAALQRISFTS